MANARKLDDPSIACAVEVATALGTDPGQGLSSQEASRRLLDSGPNELRAAAREPAWRRALAQFQDPLVYLLLAAIAIALLAWWIEGRLSWPVDAIVIAIVVLLNGALGYAQQAKAENAVAALARMTAVTSSVLRGGQSLRSAERVEMLGPAMALALRPWLQPSGPPRTTFPMT